MWMIIISDMVGIDHNGHGMVCLLPYCSLNNLISDKLGMINLII